jgi:hypothetical protein
MNKTADPAVVVRRRESPFFNRDDQPDHLAWQCTSYRHSGHQWIISRPARTTIASQVWIGFFLSLNLHRLDVVVRLLRVTQ